MSKSTPETNSFEDENNSLSGTIDTEWMKNRPAYENSGYYLPLTDEEEGDDSLTAHYAFKYILQGNYVSPINKNSMKKCLELGYCDGVWMMEMASEFPNCEFYGIDIQPVTPESTYPKNCYFLKGDFLKEIPFEEETFDLVYIRSTIRFVNSNSWKGLFKEINRVLKKGGWMEIVDSDINLERSGPKWNSIGEAWIAVQLANNINPGAFKQLDKTIKDCGFAVSNVKKFSTPIGSWGGMLGEFMIATCRRWFTLVSDILMDKLKLETREEYDEFIESVETEVNEYKTHCNLIVFWSQKSL